MKDLRGKKLIVPQGCESSTYALIAAERNSIRQTSSALLRSSDWQQLVNGDTQSLTFLTNN